MRHLYVCKYYQGGKDGPKPTNEAWRGITFTQAIKGDDLKTRRVELSVNKRPLTITNSTKDTLLDHSGDALAHIIRQARLTAPVILPIPGHDQDVRTQPSGRLLRIANRIATTLGDGAVCSPIVRWKTPQEKMRGASGHRTWRPRYDNMTVLGQVPVNRPIVIVEDVVVSASTVQGAWKHILDHGGAVSLILSVSKQVRDMPEASLGTFEEDVEEPEDLSFGF
ncbi:MAG: phosphoribosyltransferase [Alphaproteobacteria bacterium]|nr:phosphoribosyltransferase [Alphaproteobacteria bacterium]